MSEKVDKEITALQVAYAALVGLKPEAQARVLGWLAQKFGASIPLGTHGSGKPPAQGGSSGAITGEPPKPKGFMTEKKPSDFQERIACLSYYLTHYRNLPNFRTRDLTRLNGEAAQPKLSNAAVFARNAVNCQYLSLAGGGRKQITTRGEAVVEALPNRDAVKKALEEHPLVGRKGKGKKKSNKAKPARI